MTRVAPLPHRGLYEVEDDERREGYESGVSAKLRRAFLGSCCSCASPPQSLFPVARHPGSAAAAVPAVSETPSDERPRRYYSPSPSRVVPAPAGPPILVAQASTSYRAFRAFQFRGGNNSGAFAVEEEGEEVLASLQVGNGAPGERSVGN